MAQDPDIIKPQVDDRVYKSITLHNSLSVLLISDPETTFSSAALDCHVGSMADPENAPGLAHFLEHLLFMGTKKYPIENDYSEYLSTHSGHSNAFTSGENTNYYFEVSSSFLHGALDRFAQFFIDPLFSESGTERELLAVDSEHNKNLQNDSWRLYQLEKDLCSPIHPYSKFGTGNIQTLKVIPNELGLDIRSILLDFHSKYYSSNIMKLVILGKESIETLSGWAIEMFSGIKNKNIQVPITSGHPLTTEQLQIQIQVKPVKQMRHLEITFPFPDTISHYKSQPSRYIGHLIGHESQGSILSYLKSKSWATSLSAGDSHGGIGFDFFRIGIELTETGQQHYQEVVTVVFQYIKMLQEIGIQKWIYDEVSKVARVNFQFKEKGSPSSYCSKLAGYLHHYHPEDVLSGSYLLLDYNSNLINDLLQLMTPQNFKLTLCFSDFDTTEYLKAKWYDTEYKVNPFSSDFIQKLNDISINNQLFLPKPNSFIPENFELKPALDSEIADSKIFKDTELMRLWFKADDSFHVPKAHIWFQMSSPDTYVTPLNCVLARLLTELLKDAMNEYAYYAEVAGLGYSLENNTEGLILHIYGFNDKIGILLFELFKSMKKMNITPDRFIVIKDELIRSYKNWDMESPHSHAMYYVNYITQEKLWHNQDKLDELLGITFDQLVSFGNALFKNLYLEGLFYGNVDLKSANEWASIVESTLMYKPFTLALRNITTRTHIIPKGSHYIVSTHVKNQENTNSAIEYLIQFGDISNDDIRIKALLLSQIANEPCFDQLRTKEQLGYLVHSSVRKQTGMIGFRIIIQSSKHPIYIESRIEKFIQKLQEIIDTLTNEGFEKHVSALISKLIEKSKNMEQKGRKVWGSIQIKYYDFLQNERDAEALKNLTQLEMSLFFKTFLSLDSTVRRKVSVHLVSEKSNEKDFSDEIHVEIHGKNIVMSADKIPEFKIGLELTSGPVPPKPINEYKL